MPKPLLRRTQAQSETILSATRQETQSPQTKQMDKMRLDRLLRKPRSKAYMEALHQLDAGGHVHNRQKVDEIINAIRAEFPEVEISGVLLGIVAVCYLGRPYEVHSLDMSGHIVEHYPAGQTMPGGLEIARSLALRGGYDFIEVYVDCCRCVSADGTVSVVKR